MINATKHNRQALIALLLTAVLFGSILVKPVHILMFHHEHSGLIHSLSSQKTISTHHYNDCAICDFEFCTFIPQKQVIVPQVNIITTNELAFRMVACFVCYSSHNFLLRAPPVF